MKPSTRIAALTTTLLAALGMVPLSCGGTVVTSSGGDGNGGSVGSGGASATNQFPCLNPTPVIDATTGYEQCANGEIRRTRRAQCPSRIPRAEPVPDYDPARHSCQYDSDCTSERYGYCWFVSYAEYAGYLCRSGCVSDADCLAGEICVCGDPIGQCKRSTCTSGADCLAGFDCRSHKPDPGCSFIDFACQVPDDSCGGDQDCIGMFCSASSGARRCEEQDCYID